MHHRSRFIQAACLASGLLVASWTVAQDEPPPASARDLFSTVKDPQLHSALLTLADIRRKIARLGGGPQQVEFYNRPENVNAIGVVLAASESSNLSEFHEFVRNSIIEAIEAAVTSGAKKHVSTLRKLAHSSDKAVRDAVASADALLLSPSPSFEVLKECLLSAEERLPATLPNSQEASGPFDEFEDRVRLFALASDEQRAEIAPIVERFLGRYDNARFKAYYTPRLRRLLQGGSSKLHGLGASKERSPSQEVELSDTLKKPNAKPSPTPSEEPASSTPWSIIVVLIVAAGGLLWLRLKRRS